MDSTQAVLNIFEQISAIPRGTKNEAQLSRWLQMWAKNHQFSSQTDEAGNLVIRVPATAGYESAPTLVLQGHMDMVCEKTPDSPHDFTKDPIRCIVEGDWLHADRTTLGADNGIAIAFAMALAEDAAVAHPPLELLFTVEEEVGIGGAVKLKPGFISGKMLINLDSEDEGTFIIGCAGGQTTRIHLPLAFEPLTRSVVYTLKVGGLFGGHSGVDIHKQRANANKLLARALGRLRRVTPIQLVSLKGGTAHNAIAREAEVELAFDPAQLALVEQEVRAFEQVLRAEFASSDAGISLSLVPASAERAVSLADTEKVINLLLALPHGVAEMSASIAGFVETSNNLAVIGIDDESLRVTSSQRSTVMSRLEAITARITAVGALAGAEVITSDGYPAWEPNPASALVQRSVEIYRGLFGVAPEVKMIHAGLECGIIGAIFGNMDMISIGATIQNPHSPSERLLIPSVGKVWNLLVGILKSYQPS